MPNGGIMNEDEIKNMLPSIPTSMLVGELNRRRDEWREAERSLGLGVPAPVAVTKRAKHVRDTTMKDAAVDRWAAWHTFKKSHPNAKPKEYWALRRKEKA